MIFRDVHERSILPKCFDLSALLAVILLTALFMFFDVETIHHSLEPYRISGNFARRVLLCSCLVIYFFRLATCLFVFFRRKLPWIEAITVAIVMGLILFALTYVGGTSNEPINIFDIVGLALFALGSYLNSHSEYLRHQWKVKLENQGRLYTGGLFRYSMHINYFGDTILFTGWALITQSPIMLLIPLGMTVNFVFILIPRLDEYLESKYKEELREYAKRTKRFIPWIY
jgi:protein-S-isoprenylcysteine O-methyltransferase Ste14